MQVVRQDDPGFDPEGPFCPHSVHGVPQPVNLPHQQV
jgi:hypothetical protein